MGKFTNRPPLPQPSVIRPTFPAYTAEGGIGHTRDTKGELFVLAVTNMVSEESFYESAGTRDNRYVTLTHDVTAADPAWIAECARWLRQTANMRSASLVMAAEYVAAGGQNGRRVISSVLQRADEPAEMLAYWRSRYGRKTPAPIKRGVADAAVRLYTQGSSLRHDGTGSAWRMGDVLELAHPKPESAEQADLFKWLLAKRHRGTEARLESTRLPIVLRDRFLTGLPEPQRRGHLTDAVDAGWSWERIGGWLPDGFTADVWETLIPKMGYMALLRNLANFERAAVSPSAVAAVCARLANADEVKRSRQLPYRFLSAYRATSSLDYSAALEQALDLCLNNLPANPAGDTLVMLDISGSMMNALSQRSTVTRADCAGVLGFSLARAWNARVVAYNTQAYELQIESQSSVLRSMEQLRGMVGGGTYTFQTLEHVYRGEQRVVIVTDEQAHPSMTLPDIPRLYTWNVAGYGVGHGNSRPGWHTFAGFSDAAFSLIPLLENIEGCWPWEVAQ